MDLLKGLRTQRSQMHVGEYVSGQCYLNAPAESSSGILASACFLISCFKKKKKNLLETGSAVHGWHFGEELVCVRGHGTLPGAQETFPSGFRPEGSIPLLSCW